MIDNGAKVKELRYRLGLTQKELAELIGQKESKNTISKVTVSQWENNRNNPNPRRVSILNKIAKEAMENE